MRRNNDVFCFFVNMRKAVVRNGNCFCAQQAASVGSRNDGVSCCSVGFELPGKEKQRKDNPTPPKNDVFVCL